MLHGRYNSKKIKHLHERCLVLTYCGRVSSYEELLANNRSCSVHHRNIQSFVIEPFKVKNELVPMITANVVFAALGNHYNIHNHNNFRVPFARTIYHGSTDSISYLGSRIWDIVSTKQKQPPKVFYRKRCC